MTCLAVTPHFQSENTEICTLLICPWSHNLDRKDLGFERCSYPNVPILFLITPLCPKTPNNMHPNFKNKLSWFLKSIKTWKNNLTLNNLATRTGSLEWTALRSTTEGRRGAETVKLAAKWINDLEQEYLDTQVECWWMLYWETPSSHPTTQWKTGAAQLVLVFGGVKGGSVFNVRWCNMEKRLPVWTVGWLIKWSNSLESETPGHSHYRQK